MSIKDDPKFGTTIDEPVWYLAHPLASDGRYSYQQNMDHAVKMVRLFYDCGVRVICPWHTLCLALDDTNLEHRRIGLEVDCNVVRSLGRIIMVGHKVSSGMECELAMIMERGENGRVLNYVGWKDETIKQHYAKLRSD